MINDFIILTLQRRAAIKVAVCLWNQFDVNALMARIHFLQTGEDKLRKWRYIEKEVVDKAETLPVPEKLKGELIAPLIPIGLEILNWIVYHFGGCIFGMNVPKNLCWTDNGTVDKKQTAKLWIRCGQLDIIKRYKLACMYCFEEDIRMLFNQICDSYPMILWNKQYYMNETQEDLVYFWTFCERGELDKIVFTNEVFSEWCTSHEHAFITSITLGNEASTVYFLKKLTGEERKKLFVLYASLAVEKYYRFSNDSIDGICEYYSDFLRFLVTQMNEEEEVQLFQTCAYRALISFLHWPWHSLFLKKAKRFASYVSEDIFSLLLHRIVENVIYGNDDYKLVFREYWEHSTSDYKRYVIKECTEPNSLLPSLFIIEDEDTISLILKEATTTEKEAIIFSVEGRGICKNLAYEDNWDLLKFFIRKCISSRETMINFKEKLENHISTNTEIFTEEQRQRTNRELSPFLNDLIENMQ